MVKKLKKAKWVNKNVAKNTRKKERLWKEKNKEWKDLKIIIIIIWYLYIYLCFFDDKRYILEDGINILAYFHKDVKSHGNWLNSRSFFLNFMYPKHIETRP